MSKEKELLQKLDQLMYEAFILKGTLSTSLYKHLKSWVKENSMDGDPHNFVNIKEYLNQNKDEKDPNAIYGWETFPLEKNFDWNKQNKDE